MGRINILDKHVAELIAAGEVVDRPSSVIKELVENSIDAGADCITVEIKNGGTSFMRVTDNGCGIMRDDIRVAFLRHSTSKVHFENDLDNISTLGFRGEALASVCAVSHLELITKSENEETSTNYVINGGEEGALSDAGCPVGTTFIIRDLFYNIPARMKFLKKDVSEGNAVSNIVDKIALSHPQIAFTYIKDGKQALKTTGDGKALSAIYTVYGRDFANGLIPVDYELDGIRINGYISRPESARPNRNMQNFFVNDRFVKSRTAMAAIEEACKGSVMVGKFPSCVLNIAVPYDAVDVNVHPAKIEVRFINERIVFDCVYHAVKTALNTSYKAKDTVLNAKPSQNIRINPFELAQKAFRERDNDIKKDNSTDPFVQLDNINTPQNKKPMPISFASKVSDSVNPLDVYSKAALKNSEKKAEYESVRRADIDIMVDDEAEVNSNGVDSTSAKTQVKQQSEPQVTPLIDTQADKYEYIGEAFKTYIILEKNSKELILIDKHAAHEKIIFERLKKEKGNGYSQILLEPITVTLNKIDYDSAVSNLSMFSDTGFDVDDFGNGVLLVRSAPQYLEKEDIEQTVIEMAGYMTENKKVIKSEQMEWIYHNVSCRAAIKAGNKSTQAELVDIAKQVQENPEIRYCPHGRPVCIVLSKHEIEKQFGRV